MAEIFPKLMTDIKLQMQEAQRTASRINARKEKYSNCEMYYIQTAGN